MQVRLKEQGGDSIHVSEMKDGDMAVMMPSWTGYEGVIVQRHGCLLVRLGKCRSMGWSNLNSISEQCNPGCRVRLLRPGDVLVIE